MSHDSSGYQGKRKKTWREIDANRNRSHHTSRQETKETSQIARSPSYTKYKKAADAIFSQAELPKALAEQFDSQGTRKAFQTSLRKLMQPEDRASWVKGVLEFVEQYDTLPDDIYFLDSLLDHPKEKIVSKALEHLEQLLQKSNPLPKCPPSLEQRLKSIELGSLDDELQAQAKRLREKLRP
ncbi:MAG: hypothetical protein FWC28_00495 [Proteobacteria bacterium]|nr:hypothetical protein [Cystobacterineae bacterium]MCL2313721.1 hypothetical protein [Pseudomonadota bacterium]